MSICPQIKIFLSFITGEINLLRKNGLIFFKIIFAMSRYAQGEFASERPMQMFGWRHEGSGRPTPIFRYKIITETRLNIFA